MFARSVIAYALGVLGAGIACFLELFMREQGDFAGAANLSAVFTAIAVTIAWVPFAIFLSLGRVMRLPSWISRLASGALTATAMTPLFIFLDSLLMASMAGGLEEVSQSPDIDLNRLQDIVATAFKASLNVGAIAGPMPSLVPWMVGYGLVGGLVYHLVRSVGRRRSRGVPAVFA